MKHVTAKLKTPILLIVDVALQILTLEFRSHSPGLPFGPANRIEPEAVGERLVLFARQSGAHTEEDIRLSPPIVPGNRLPQRGIGRQIVIPRLSDTACRCNIPTGF